MVRVGINGFGRIGRAVFRKALEDSNINIVHINDLTDTATLAHLLSYDSVHGRLKDSVECTQTSISVGGCRASTSSLRSPVDIPWRDKGVDIVFECTGLFTKRDACEMHLQAGARKVLVSAPAKDEDLTVVYGVNHESLRSHHNIVSNGSCTTNCLAPPCKVIHENFGIQRAMMTTIHSYTGDQRILDFPHKDLRRARAGAINIIPTTTGAAKAIGLVIPELKGLVDGYAVRVPTPNVSLVDVSFQLSKKTTVDQVNKKLIEASNTYLSGVMSCLNAPLVSSDINGDSHSSVVDLQMTKVVDDYLVKVVAWYDNEIGFSARMLDVASLMGHMLTIE
jgi:glyceraldehyde 3-phosphate dehydrogenase